MNDGSYTVIYRRYVVTNVGASLYRDFKTLEDACRFGDKEFADSGNFDCHLRLPSGRTMAFTKMFGLI